MVLNDTTNKQNSLYHYTIFLLGLDSADTTSFPIADFTRSANSWLRKLVFLIWKSSTTWEFDDKNYTTLPIATTTLVAEQQDYELPTNSLDIQRVEVLDQNNNYLLVTQFDKAQIQGSALTEYYETSGTPRYYDIIGNSLFLYPKPATTGVTTALGLKLYLARDIDQFVDSDTTKEPGIQLSLHPYLAYGGAMDYAIARNLDNAKAEKILLVINQYEQQIKDWATKRNVDMRVRIRPNIKNPI